MVDTDNVNDTSIGTAIGGSVHNGGSSPVVGALARHFGLYKREDDSKDSTPDVEDHRNKNGATG